MPIDQAQSAADLQSPSALAQATIVNNTSGGGNVPAGAVMPFAGTSIPSGWLFCDGSTVDGTNSTYTALWNAIGTTYGGTGQASFKIPDLQGRIPVCKGTNASVSTLNNNDGQTAANRRPHHRTSNSLVAPNHTHSTGISAAYAGTGGLTGFSGASQYLTEWDGSHSFESNPPNTGGPSNTTLTGSIGTNNANDALDTPSYIVLNYIIKL